MVIESRGKSFKTNINSLIKTFSIILQLSGYNVLSYQISSACTSNTRLKELVQWQWRKWRKEDPVNNGAVSHVVVFRNTSKGRMLLDILKHWRWTFTTALCLMIASSPIHLVVKLNPASVDWTQSSICVKLHDPLNKHNHKLRVMCLSVQQFLHHDVSLLHACCSVLLSNHLFLF